MFGNLVAVCNQLMWFDLVCLFLLFVLVSCLSSYTVDVICAHYYKAYADCVTDNLLYLITSIKLALEDSDFVGQKFYLALHWNPKLSRTRKFYIEDRPPLTFKSFGCRKHLVTYLGQERVTRSDILELLDAETLSNIHCDSDGLYLCGKFHRNDQRTRYM